jgi:hypothetical protein
MQAMGGQFSVRETSQLVDDTEFPLESGWVSENHSRSAYSSSTSGTNSS